MPSPHEAAVAALVAALAGHSADVMREQELPHEVDASGLINVVPGDPEEDDQELGTGRRLYQRVIELEHVVQAASEAARNDLMDAILVETATLLFGSTLGGAVDYVRLEAPVEADNVPIDGAASAKGAVLEVTLFYQTANNPMETQS